MTTDVDVAKRSVTRSDIEAMGGLAGHGPVWYFSIPWSSVERQGMLPLEAPEYWSLSRDILLRSTPLRESMWANVVFKVTTRIASFGWNISDVAKSERRVQKTQELLHGADFGAGWVPFISKVVKDYLCTDNGAFIEIIRASTAAGSRVIGLRHLDSLRCWRTGDIEYPVVYNDLKGGYHAMRAHQVITFADSPASDPMLRGVGLCAASRAYRPITKLQYLQNYVLEKISGQRPLAIYFVNGATEEQLRTAVAGARQEAEVQGYVTFMGAVIVPTFRPEPPQVASIDLAGLPDTANIQDERRDSYLHMAHAAGLFVGEIQPLEGQYGTGTQSTVLSDAAQGQGMASLVAQLEHSLSQNVLPTTTIFTLTNVNDFRDQKMKADIGKVRAEVRKIQKESGEIDEEQIRQLAADQGDIPDSFLEKDLTPNADLSDNAKPVPEGEQNDGDTTHASATDDSTISPEAMAAGEAAVAALTKAASVTPENYRPAQIALPPAHIAENLVYALLPTAKEIRRRKRKLEEAA